MCSRKNSVTDILVSGFLFSGLATVSQSSNALTKTSERKASPVDAQRIAASEQTGSVCIVIFACDLHVQPLEKYDRRT